MRLALIGRFGGRPDEGMRKLCGQWNEVARGRHEVITIRASDFCRGVLWKRLRRFRPRCLHYLTGPTIFGLAALKVHKSTLARPITSIATGVRPNLGRVGRSLLGLLAPDIYLAQARGWRELFAAAGSRIVDLPNPVDMARFVPVAPGRKGALRARWGIEPGAPIVLHVGHIRENRGLDSLIAVGRSGRYRVWIVGSESASRSTPLRRRLEEAGCRVDTRFVPRIEEIYQASDIYVFTVRPRPPGTFKPVGVIDFPLSILEALACGLPVLTPPHDALVHFLGSAPGVTWFDGTGGDCLRSLDALAPQTGCLVDHACEFGLPGFRRRVEGLYDSIENPGCLEA